MPPIQAETRVPGGTRALPPTVICPPPRDVAGHVHDVLGVRGAANQHSLRVEDQTTLALDVARATLTGQAVETALGTGSIWIETRFAWRH